MAKKQSMNLFEAHLEKVAIGAAGLVFLWVLVTRFILSSGIETPSGIQSVDEAVPKAAQRAEEILRTIRRTPDFTPERVDPPEDPTEDVAFNDSPIDKIPLGPVSNPQLITASIKDKIANFPKKIAGPRALSLGIYHTRASLDPAAAASTVVGAEIQEIDFVTVEGIFSLGQIRSLFQQSFENPNLKKPVDYPEPIVAAVELQRAQLMPNGSWSEWQRISRLDIDPGSVSDPSDDFKDYSAEKYKAILNVRNSAYMQKRVLQPMPYALVSEEWLPPTERAKLKKEEAKTRRAPGGGPGRVPGLTGTVRPPMRAPARSPSKRSPTRESDMFYGEMEESYGRDAPPDNYGREGRRNYGAYAGRMRSTQVSSQEMKEAQEYLKQDEVSLWAHDESVVPGVVYRYQMRLGFFNPIAGTDRFLPGDIAYKNKIILWSDFLPNNANDHKFVQVDKRVLFFPLRASSGEKAVATVEVFRQHEGRWYQRPYPVVPGSTIGGVDPPVEKNPRRTTRTRPTPGRPTLVRPGRTAILPNAMAAAEPEKIDFRTGVTIIDITPKTVHWYSSGSSNSLKQQTTPDLVYRDVDGFVKSVPVDNRCWPKELRKQRADILKKIREANTLPRTGAPQRATTPRRSGSGGGYAGRDI